MASNDSDKTLLYRPGQKSGKPSDNDNPDTQASSEQDDATQLMGAKTQIVRPRQSADTSSGQASNNHDETVLYRGTDASHVGARTDASYRNTSATTGGIGQGKASTAIPKVINNRFVLGKSLGSGGMGTVFKAKDMRKVEAKDRNPWVAVKLLNNAFKEHPDAFISLQREARKTQGLAHPNIVRVYDFDREGDTVYMTMELLEGQPLDKVIKQNPMGLSQEDAFQLIRELGGALNEAHKVNIIHSDFKPGNIFYTEDKVSKVFDFGIARAVSDMDVDVAASTKKSDTKRAKAKIPSQTKNDDTWFDAGDLGALTPTYASYEMLKGLTPSPSDDLYALGCVAYELLTGKHPYGRLPADKAREKKLKAPNVKGLNRREQQALRKAVAFKQEDRYETIEEFLHDFLPEHHRWKRRIKFAAALMIVVGAGAGWKYYEVMEEKRIHNQQLAAEQAHAKQKAEELKQMQALMAKQEALREQLEDAFKKYEVQAQELKSELDQQVYLSAFADSYEWQLGTTKKIDALSRVFEDTAWMQPYKQGHEGAEFSGIFQEADNQRLEALASTEAWIEYFKKKVSNVYIDQADDFIASAELEKARDMYKLARQYDPQGQPVLDLEARLNQAFADKESLRRQAIYKQRLAAYSRKNKALLGELSACSNKLAGNGQANSFTFDVRGYGDKLKKLNKTYASLGKPVDDATRKHMASLANCIKLYGFSDPNGAKAQVKVAKEQFPTYAEVFDRVAIRPYNTCKTSFAEKGRRYTCQDRFIDQLHVKGPKLVVVPSSGEFNMFAIGKYEVSQAEWNRYCNATKACKAGSEKNASLPVTGISPGEIQDYLAWLSNETGFIYQLPTYRQWLYASTARNGDLDQNRNCSMSVRGVNKGMRMVPATMGNPNRWGLINHVGNAQELVVNGKDYLMAGGSRVTQMDDCNLGTVVVAENADDKVNGFRVMRIIR